MKLYRLRTTTTSSSGTSIHPNAIAFVYLLMYVAANSYTLPSTLPQKSNSFASISLSQPEKVYGIDFLPQGNDLILTACDDHIARVWNIYDTQPTPLKEYPKRHGGMINSKNIVVSRDDDEVVAWFLGFKRDDQSDTTPLKTGDDTDDALKNDGTVFLRYTPALSSIRRLHGDLETKVYWPPALVR